MQLTQSIKLLDNKLCSYIASNDPLKKSGINNAFMQKKEISNFYNKMLIKTNQQFLLQQKPNTSFDHSKNALLKREQDRVIKKINLKLNNQQSQGMVKLKIKDKQNEKINMKPLINQIPIKNKTQTKLSESKFLKQANHDLFLVQFIQGKDKSIQQERKNKSMSLYLNKNNKQTINMSSSQYIQRNSSQCQQMEQKISYDDSIFQGRSQLMQLYQKLYEQFKDQKMRTMHSKSKIQGKFSKGMLYKRS